jgi:SAM-dependent methyltransferase
MTQPAFAPCLACGGSPAFLGNRDRYAYVRCQSCGTIQLSPFPSPADVERAYQASAYANDNAHGQGSPDDVRKSSSPYYEAIRDVLVRYGVNDGVLDYGAGWGGLVELLHRSGIQSSGLELSVRMVDECRARGLPVDVGDFRSALFGAVPLRAVTMCGVFEHLIDPKAFLRHAFDALNPGGLIVSLQPTAPFAYLLASVSRFGRRSSPLPSAFYVYDPPWHAALFSIDGMARLVGDYGFDVCETLPAPQGRLAGAKGALQVSVGAVNRLGWTLFHSRWPLLVAHIFVLRKGPS